MTSNTLGGIGLTIGIYDAGLGGLSVWRELRRLVTTPLVYFGDTAHLPYGEKSPDQLVEYFWDSYAFFESRGCQSIVVACNTASAIVLPRLQSQIQLPVFGMVDAAVEATMARSKGRVGILATQATVASGVYQEAFRKAAPEGHVFVQAAPSLAPLVEQGEIRSPKTRQALQEYLQPLLAEKIDTLLLGCTHYSFLQELIRDEVGLGMAIIDPAPAVALEVQQSLASLAVRSAETAAQTEFWVSSNPARFKSMAELVLQEMLPLVGLYHRAGEKP